MDTDIADAFPFNQGQQLCHPIPEWFSSNEAHFGKQHRLMGQMLSTAEANFESNFAGQASKRIIEINPQFRQQFIHEPQMMTAQSLTPAPSKKLKGSFFFAHFTAAVRAVTRSIFSQEKPPSFSAVRPKWP